jgi:hypothetical protein
MLGRVQSIFVGILALAAALGTLAGCSHSDTAGGPQLVKRHAAASVPAGGGADQGPTDLVAAVANGGGDNGPVGLKFQLGQRPVAGQPVVITLRIAANQPLELLSAAFLPDEGLVVGQGGDFAPQGHMEAGGTVDHTLTVTPSHDGVYTVLATVTAGSPEAAISRNFVIPIVVGAPLADVPVPIKPITAKTAAAKPKSHLSLPF